MDERNKQAKLESVREILAELFGDCVSVTVELNIEGMSVWPDYRESINGFSMRRIDGTWVPQLDKTI